MTRLSYILTLVLFLSAPAFAQSDTEQTAGTASETTLSEDALERHVGDYELQPGVVLSITRAADRLFASATGQDAFEMVATSETEFSVSAFEAQITFNRAPDGATESLTLHQNGMIITADRVE
ncbi:MAG: hypothetical protein Rubg2KO_11210 [Rubricoccaceae bacterium]